MPDDTHSHTQQGESGLHMAVRGELVQMLVELEEVRRRQPAPAELEQLLVTLRRTLTTVDRLDTTGEIGGTRTVG